MKLLEQIQQNDLEGIRSHVVTAGPNVARVLRSIRRQKSAARLHAYRPGCPEMLAGFCSNEMSKYHFILDECCIETPFIEVCRPYAALGAQVSIIMQGQVLTLEEYDERTRSAGICAECNE